MTEPTDGGRSADAGAPKVRGAVASSLLAHGVGMVSNLAAVPLFLRAFGQELYGFWGAILALTSYLSLLNLGIAQTVSSRTAVLTATNDLDEAARTVWYGFRRFSRAVLLALGPICVAAWLVPWAQLFGIHSTPPQTLKWAAVLVGATFLIQLPLGVPRAALVGAGGVVPDRLINIAAGLARLGVAWIVASLALSLPTTVVVLFAVTAVSAGVTMAVLHGRVPSIWRRRGGEPPRDVGEFTRSSSHYLLLQVAGALVWSTDAFLAGVLVDARAAAQVSVAWRVASAVLPLGQLVGPAISPALVRSWAQGRKEEANGLASAATQLAVGVTAATALSMMFAAGPLFAWWVGREVYVGDAPWGAYCVLITVQALLAIPDSFVMLAGRHQRYARWTLVEAGAKVALTLLLVRWLGLLGFPLATLLARVPTVYVLLHETAHAFGITVSRWTFAQLRPTLLAAPAFLPAALPLAAPRLHTTAWALGTVAVSLSIFTAVFWRFGLDRDVKTRLLRAFRLRA